MSEYRPNSNVSNVSSNSSSGEKRKCTTLRKSKTETDALSNDLSPSLDYRKFNAERWKLPEHDAFVPHMTSKQALRLKVGDEIDHRDYLGRFYYATIKEKNGTIVKIHYNGWKSKWDVLCDLKTEFYRFAVTGSISKRSAMDRTLSRLKVGDGVDVNPIYHELCTLNKNNISWTNYQLFQVGQKIDVKDSFGRWYKAVIRYVKPKYGAMPKHLSQKKKIKLFDVAAIYIKYCSWGDEWNEWILHQAPDMICTCSNVCSSEKSIHRLAAPNTQSKWKNGLHAGWKYGQINKIDKTSGQIEVIYHDFESKNDYLFWTHLDNKDEIALNYSKCKDPKTVKYIFPKTIRVRRSSDVQHSLEQTCQYIKGVSMLFFASLSRLDYEIVDVQKLPKNEIYEAIVDKKCREGMKRDDIERYLWHGTKVQNIELIVKNGFDRSFNRRSTYGNGTYFAVRAAYCASPRYCQQDASGHYTLLLCKVLTGSYVVGHSKMKKIPIKSDGTEYESMVNRLVNPSIFVVWRDYHAVPCYVVKFVVKGP